MSMNKPLPGKDGNKYIPFEERTGESSEVFFTRDLHTRAMRISETERQTIQAGSSLKCWNLPENKINGICKVTQDE